MVVRMARAVTTLGLFAFYTTPRFTAIQIATRRFVLGMGHGHDAGSLGRETADARACK